MTTRGLVYDRVAFTWVTPEEMAARNAIREERMFQRRARQGELQCPMIIRDGQGGINGVQSMVDGKHYDSKSAMRRHYREAGVTEVGNDPSVTPEGIASHRQPRARLKSQAEKDARHAANLFSCRKARSQMNLTSYRKDEIR